MKSCYKKKRGEGGGARKEKKVVILKALTFSSSQRVKYLKFNVGLSPVRVGVEVLHDNLPNESLWRYSLVEKQSTALVAG